MNDAPALSFSLRPGETLVIATDNVSTCTCTQCDPASGAPIAPPIAIGPGATITVRVASISTRWRLDGVTGSGVRASKQPAP